MGDIVRKPGQARGLIGGNVQVSRWSRMPLGVRLLILLFVPVLLVGVMEIWAQGKRPQLPGWSGPNGARGLMDAHPTRLWGMSKGAAVPNAEGSTASINSLGFRGPEVEEPKPEGRLRVLTTGDSSFYGFGVNDAEVFTSVLGETMRALDMDVDVINTGVGGYTVAQHSLVMKESGWALDPDLLILANVWSDNTWDTFHDEDLLRSNRFAAANPLTRSALVKLVAAWLSAQRDADEGRVIVWNAADGWPDDKVRRVPLDRWMLIHDAMLVEAANRGTGALFIKPTNSFLIAEDHNGPPPAWEPYFAAMDVLARHHNIPIVDVTAVYKQAMEGGVAAEELLWDKMHPTALGHRVLSAAIWETLSQSKWPENRLVPDTEPFSGDLIEDLPQPRWTDDAGSGSPQLKLFEMTAEDKAAMDAKKKLQAEQGPPLPSGVLPPGEASEPGGASPTGGKPVEVWPLEIEVRGGQGPYEVAVLDGEGRAVGRARLQRAVRFSLKIPDSVQTVRVEVTDATGDLESVGASIEAAAALLDLGD